MRTTRTTLAVALLAALSGCGHSDETEAAPVLPGDDGGVPDAEDDGAEPVDPVAFAQPPKSCAYKCPITNCAELTTPYACQNLGAWDAIPHAESCGDGPPTPPEPAAGKCTATAPTGEAIKYAGDDPDRPGVRILPDGRRIHPAGATWVLDDGGLEGGLTSSILVIPGTSWAIAVDAGSGPHVARAVDLSKLDGTTDPVTGAVAFHDPEELSATAAIAFLPPDHVLLATSNGVVQALTLDTTSGALARDDARAIQLEPSKDPVSGAPSPWYASAVAVSPDGSKLLVGAVFERRLLVYDLADDHYGAKLGEVDLGDDEVFQVAFDPFDASGHAAYASLWGAQRVVAIDLSDAAQPKVARSFATDQDPQGMAFLDATWLAVGNDLGDTVSLVDRISGTVTSVPVDLGPSGPGFVAKQGAPGLEPSGLAYDPTSQRLYATLAGIDAVAAWQVDTSASPPTLVPLGRLPTAWWPSAAAVLEDGRLLVANLRGLGGGPVSGSYFGSDISGREHGALQLVPFPSPADLIAGEAEVAGALAVADQPGYPAVVCPEGTPGSGDFPVPATLGAPSAQIRHVFFIVRENKDFDGVLGDMPGVNGDPQGTLKSTTAEMERIWPNFRALARDFTVFDNYYTDAVYSTQGHVWATYGRTSDFDERTWALDARPIPLGGIAAVGRPAEGSLFEWLQSNDVRYDVLGEIVGAAPSKPGVNAVDAHYPGGPFQNILYNDDEKACYIAGRARVRCDLGSFVYATITNDHAAGVSPSSPAPETYVAVNDEATGMLVDAITHSPYWPSSLIVITEDDPSQGGDHVDGHRAPLVMISPWVKRGYVSKTHLDVASLHKLFAHVLGKPYRSLQVASAGLPLDAFTSTPSYAAWDRKARAWTIACGDGATQAEQRLTESWDLSEADEQPGLDAQVERWMRGRQLDVLPPAIEAAVARRERARAAAAQGPHAPGGAVDRDDD